MTDLNGFILSGLQQGFFCHGSKDAVRLIAHTSEKIMCCVSIELADSKQKMIDQGERTDEFIVSIHPLALTTEMSFSSTVSVFDKLLLGCRDDLLYCCKIGD